MFIDAQNQFSNAQAVTAQAVSTNIVDLGIARDIGTGEDVYLEVNVTVAMTDAGSDSTLTVTLQGDTTSAFGAAVSQDLFIIPAVSAAGSVFYAKLSPGSTPLQKQFIRLQYTPNNGNLTTGSFTASLVKGIQKYVAYAKNFTVS